MKGKTEEALVLDLINIEPNNMYIAVLMFETGEVIIKEVSKELEELDGDDILTSMGFDIGNTEYMVVDSELPILIDLPSHTSRILLN